MTQKFTFLKKINVNDITELDDIHVGAGEYIATWRLKAGIVELERKSIASQRLAKHTFPQQKKTTKNQRKFIASKRFGKHISMTTDCSRW
jgi:hypothetical protein